MPDISLEKSSQPSQGFLGEVVDFGGTTITDSHSFPGQVLTPGNVFEIVVPQ